MWKRSVFPIKPSFVYSGKQSLNMYTQNFQDFQLSLDTVDSTMVLTVLVVLSAFVYGRFFMFLKIF